MTNRPFLYHINTDYINFLKGYDGKVQNNYEDHQNHKPYVGIILRINNFNYFAPLTSPKEKHRKLANSQITIFKIEDKNKFYGSVLLNNMIPVKDSYISKIDIANIEDTNYKNLLNTEYRIILSNFSKIEKKARTLYNIVTKESQTHFFCTISCNFRLLEKVCENFEIG